MKRYDIEVADCVCDAELIMGECTQGEYLKRDEVIAALVQCGVGELGDDIDCVLDALGITDEEYNAAESSEHERKHCEDPEPAEYRGDR